MSAIYEYLAREFGKLEFCVLIASLRLTSGRAEDILITKVGDGLIAGLPSPWSVSDTKEKLCNELATEYAQISIDADLTPRRLIEASQVQTVELAWLHTERIHEDLRTPLRDMIEGNANLEQRLSIGRI